MALKAADRLESAVHLGKINTDDEEELADRFVFRGIPTMILFSHGREIAHHSGLMDTTAIEAWVEHALGK